MARDSDDFLFTFNIVACVWIVILAIVALLCYRVELYSNEPSDVINVASASWD